jgi:hypothetical protein
MKKSAVFTVLSALIATLIVVVGCKSGTIGFSNKPLTDVELAVTALETSANLAPILAARSDTRDGCVGMTVWGHVGRETARYVAVGDCMAPAEIDVSLCGPSESGDLSGTVTSIKLTVESALTPVMSRLTGELGTKLPEILGVVFDTIAASKTDGTTFSWAGTCPPGDL